MRCSGRSRCPLRAPQCSWHRETAAPEAEHTACTTLTVGLRPLCCSCCALCCLLSQDRPTFTPQLLSDGQLTASEMPQPDPVHLFLFPLCLHPLPTCFLCPAPCLCVSVCLCVSSQDAIWLTARGACCRRCILAACVPHGLSSLGARSRFRLRCTPSKAPTAELL
jgi:hypothetical protein